MKRQRFVSQGSLSRLFQSAAEAWKRAFGRAYGFRYDYGNSARCFEKASRVAPRKTETLAEAGRRCREFGNQTLAQQYLERAANEKGVVA